MKTIYNNLKNWISLWNKHEKWNLPMKKGDKLIGPNGAKYTVTVVDGEYFVVERDDPDREALPETFRIHKPEVKYYTDANKRLKYRKMDCN